MHRCERNKMKQFAAFRCKMRQISAEQDEANRSRLKRFAGVCRRPEEIKRQRWLLYDGPDWCWLTPERFLCIPVWSICGPAGPVNGAATWGHRRAFRSILKSNVLPGVVFSLLPLEACCCGLMRLVAYVAIPHHISDVEKDIEKRLKAFVATLQGPLGQIPFERAVARHLPLFLELRRHGLAWMSIAGLLRSRDVRRANGRLISADQLRSVVSRQGRRSNTNAATDRRRSHS